MQTIDETDATNLIKQAAAITFLTGAGISTASGVPDYRSLSGVYLGIERPEYLLSHTCMVEEPEKFYSFVQTLYHPKAEPNSIHLKMAELENIKDIWIISQNIDGLHAKAKTQQLVNFHGNLYDCYCRKCGQSVSADTYLTSDRHEQCGGQIRPNIVLYEEGLDEQAIAVSVEAIAKADLIVIVGTSFQVHPFCDLIHYAKATATILVINQTPIHLNRDAYFLKEDAMKVFKNRVTEER
ncbi:NAD-dependent protein deacylase [Enterococcus caccae]|uniref:protein acetyllysine N-acetyltransferase n=1 Tax=Enterococcus caccae ATCC BAA-1240 TaxID=1158612 RepID=R3WAY8_9ENTE|nr:NAD-dependent protein deacylase [Enterococcus caccae]EOL44617.1 NAD-dependent deacetylase [Enterococcus caccae ATCC BAA-1240]EOT58760.1 NAD-dependent deacetylase [Enterococcus caccae ATCC BAA-1240]